MKYHRHALIGTSAVGVLLGVIMFSTPPMGTHFLMMGLWIILPALIVTAFIGWLAFLGVCVFTKKKPERSLIDFASGSSYLAFSFFVAMFTIWALGSAMSAWRE